MKIESELFTTHVQVKEIIDFLAIPVNLEKILPPDRIQSFESDDTQCNFKIQGGINISLVFVQQTNSSVRYKSGEKSPFPFELTAQIEEIPDGSSGQLIFIGDTSPFISMMAKGPLTALFNDMGRNLIDLIEKSK
jgi:hypothetical protein